MLRLTLLLCFFVIALAGQAWADKRVALVIGNSNYRNVPQLPNPINDANAIALLFKNAGFEVVETRRDVGIGEMRRAVRDFSAVAGSADIAVMFYAGHGIEFAGSNYLIPIDATLESDIDVADETVSLDRILTVLEPAKRLRLVILDACRDNPFIRTMKRTMARRSIGRGLAEVEPTTSDTLIAFAAKGGSTAADGEGDHSPFTAALLRHIALPGLDVRLAFGRVRDEVLKVTRNKQEPFVYGSLGGGTVALVSSSTTGADAGSVESTASAQVSRDYELTAQIGTPESWNAFLAKHPTGFYAELARAQSAIALLLASSASAIRVSTVTAARSAPTDWISATRF